MNQQLNNNQPKIPEKKNGSSGIIIAIVVVILFYSGFSIFLSNSLSTTPTKPQQQITTTNKPPVFSSPVETIPPITNSFDLSIKSISVKKEDGLNYRYSFSIRNKEDKKFNGTITISLLDKNGEVVADPEILTRSFGELYSEDDNDVIFFTRKASPASVVKFKYVVMMNNEVIEQGEDVIGDLL